MSDSIEAHDEHESNLPLKNNEHRTGGVVEDANQLTIAVTQYKKVVSNYESFVVFRILTETGRPEFGDRTNFVVERRYSIFEWLHSRLTHDNPALFVPPLPGKMVTSVLDRYSDPFLSDRLWGLNAFLSRVAKHLLLSSNVDLIAFLTLTNEELEKYRSKHSRAGPISTMLADTRLGITNLFTSPSGVFASSTSSDTNASESWCFGKTTKGRVGTSAMRQYEQEFKELSDEASLFSETAQNMARTTEFIATHLDNLSSGFSDLARCLDQWPPSLIVEPSNWTDSTDPMDARLSLDRVQRLRALVLLSKTFGSVGNETADLSSRLRKQTLLRWRESTAYGQSVLGVLESRDELEKRYFRATDQLRREVTHVASAQNNRLTVTAKSYFKWHQQSLSQLVSDVHRLQDRVALSNGQILSEFEHWQTERYKETLRNLLDMSEMYVNYWTRLANNWRSTLTELQDPTGGVGDASRSSRQIPSSCDSHLCPEPLNHEEASEIKSTITP